jgi:phage baseplate assembly protein W
MADLQLTFGNDLTIDATGDIAVSDGSQEGMERVLRRLLTNQLEYIWQPAYGAGLASFLGQPAIQARIQAVIRSQMFQEAAVAQEPPPSITVTAQADNTVFANIQYVDANTGSNVTLSFTVGP